MELETTLITGSSGFVWSHLTRFLEQKKMPYIHFSGDLLDRDIVRQFFADHPSIRQVVHLVWAFDGDFDTLLKLNLDTTRFLLETMRQFWVNKIIFASTGAVYGEPIGTVSYEEDPLYPNTLYGLSKKLSEEIVSYYSRIYWFCSIILRFPNIYGNGSRSVVSRFLSSIQTEGKIVIHGDGTQSRNFLYIDDAAEAITLAIRYEDSGTFNITNPVKTSLNDLVHILKQRYSFSVEYIPQENNHLRDLLLSPDKAKKCLGFTAKHTMIHLP